MKKEIKPDKKPKDVKKLYIQEKTDRAKRCELLINKALEEERCVFKPSMIVNESGNIFRIDIVALD